MEPIQGVILAGGLGTRLEPATTFYNKHLYIVGRMPLITHSIRALVQAGVENILICTNGPDREFFPRILGSGEEWGCNLFYRVQKEMSEGSGQTILMAEPFVKGNKRFVVVHGDGVFFHPLPLFHDKEAPHLFVMPTPEEDLDDARKYGQVQLSGREGVVALKEGEEKGFSSFIQIAVWIFTTDVFRCIRNLQQKHSGEVRTAEIVQEYIKDRHRRLVNYTMLPARSYIDCGTWPAIRKAEELLLEQTKTGR